MLTAVVCVIFTRSQIDAPCTDMVMGYCTCFCRGGPESSDHVNVLSNHHLLRDILRLAAGKASTMEDRIYSEIDKIAASVDI